MDYELDDDVDRIDRDVVWAFLSTHAYWARWRGREHVERQLASAWRLIGAYRKDTGEMIGFARGISDGVSFGYLTDLFVVHDARGHGLGKALVHAMVADGPGADFRWLLHTSDAHELYRRFGFRKPDETLLERPGANPPTI